MTQPAARPPPLPPPGLDRARRRPLLPATLHSPHSCNTPSGIAGATAAAPRLGKTPPSHRHVQGSRSNTYGCQAPRTPAWTILGGTRRPPSSWRRTVSTRTRPADLALASHFRSADPALPQGSHPEPLAPSTERNRQKPGASSAKSAPSQHQHGQRWPEMIEVAHLPPAPPESGDPPRRPTQAALPVSWPRRGGHPETC